MPEQKGKDMLQLARLLLEFLIIGIISSIGAVWCIYVFQVCRAIAKRVPAEEFRSSTADAWENWYAVYVLPAVGLTCLVGILVTLPVSLSQKAWGTAGVFLGLLLAEAFSWYMWSNKYKTTRFVKILYYLSPLLVPIATFCALVTVGGY